MRTNKHRGNITPSLLCGILCALTLCGYIPAISYLSNANFYSFTLSQLLLGMLPAFLAMTALLSALLFVLVCLFQAKCPRLACETPGGKWRLTIVHVALALLVFAIWLEGSPLSFGLPQLTGDTGLFSTTSRAVWDSLVWVAVLVTAALFWRVLGQNLAYVLVGVCLLMALGLGDAAKNSEPRAQVSTTANEVLDRVSLHAEDNVLVLVLDAMSTAVIQDYLTENPDFGDALDGFTLFQNNLESASSTQWALPSMLKGDIYNGGPVLDYQSDLYDAPESVAQTFYMAGYDVYASSTLPRFNRYLLSGATQANESRKAVSLPRSMYGQFWVRFVPYALKNTVSSRADISGTVNDTVNLPGGNLEVLEGYESAHTDEITYQVLSMAAKRGDSAAPTFQFHHVNGSHKPYTIGLDGHPLPEAEQGTLYGLREQSAWTLRNVEKLLLALKADGRYDGATIVLLGDHGDRLDDSFRDNMAYARRAALLVKPVGSHGPLAFSTAPTSNSYLPQLLTAVHLEGMDLHAATAGLPEQRQVLMDGTRIHVYEGTDVTALTHVESIEVVQEYDATVLSRGKQYVLSTQDVSAEMAYPLHFENGNISNGWGLRILGEEMRACFLVDARPGQPVNAHIVLATSALVGGYADFAPYDLTVRDETGSREWVFPVDDNRTSIKLNDVVVSEDATVRLAFSLSRHPDPDTMQVSLSSILLEEPSQEVRDNATVLQAGHARHLLRSE